MIGNDIVDFSLDEQKYSNRRFKERILTKKEQDYLSRSQHPNQFLWALWAAKEAAFKALQRTHPKLTFSPRNFSTTVDTLKDLLTTPTDGRQEGKIEFQQQTLSVRYHWPKDTVVHCVACLKPEYWRHIDSRSARVPHLTTYQQQSQAVRELAHKIMTKHQIHANIIRPTLTMPDYNKPGPPILVNPRNQKPLPHIISLSHDHDHVAVALYYQANGLE